MSTEGALEKTPIEKEEVVMPTKVESKKRLRNSPACREIKRLPDDPGDLIVGPDVFELAWT